MNDVVPTVPDGEDLILAGEVREDLQAMQVGPIPETEDERELFRFVRLLTRYRLEADRIEDQSRAMVKELRAKADWLLHSYGFVMQNIVRKMLGAGIKRSIKTPFGTAGFRAAPARLECVEVALLLRAWEDQLVPRECVTQTVHLKPVSAELTRIWKETGELPPGCDLVDGHDTFYVR